MSALLVSVRDADEAIDACAGGANIIDIKEPRRGSLGRADVVVWRQVAACVDTGVPVSVALGELMHNNSLPRADAWTGICFAKWGLAGCRRWPDWPSRWAAAVDALAPHVRSVGVIYADDLAAESPAAADIVSQAARLGCWGILFDTYQKRGTHLFDLLPVRQLAPVIESIRDHGMAVSLAGSLDARQLDLALELEPDVIAVRSAACLGGRMGRVDQEKVRRLAQITSDSPTGNRASPARSPGSHFGGSKNT